MRFFLHLRIYCSVKTRYTLCHCHVTWYCLVKTHTYATYSWPCTLIFVNTFSWITAITLTLPFTLKNFQTHFLYSTHNILSHNSLWNVNRIWKMDTKMNITYSLENGLCEKICMTFIIVSYVSRLLFFPSLNTRLRQAG